MRLATDNALAALKRPVLIGVVLTACLVELGCAQLRSFQKDAPAAFGTSVASKTDGVAAKGGDLYAARFRDAQAQTAIARRDDARAAERPVRDSGRADQSGSLAAATSSPGPRTRSTVTLNTPVPLQTAVDHPPVVASHAPQAGWISADELAAAGANPPGPSVAGAGAPSPDNPPAQPETTVESLIAATRNKLESLSNYQVHLNRQERVDSALQPAEAVLLSIRRNPKAVRLEWPEGSHKGREVIYSATENGGLMHVNMADSIVPVPRLSIAPDNVMVLRNSRHPITEAGFDTIVRNLELSLEKSKKGDASGGKITYGGLERPEGLDQPCHKIVRLTPTGETWLVYLDPQTQLPAMIQGTAPTGELLERYLFSDVKSNLPQLASKDAFDPNQRWGESQGLLSRIARGAGARTAPETTTR